MKHTKSKGFVIVTVLLLLALFGLALFVLTGSSKTTLSASHSAIIEAKGGNLLSSGLAWAKMNREELYEQGDGFTIQLDVTDFDLDDATCIIAVDKKVQPDTDFLIKAYFSKGRRKFEQSIRLRSDGCVIKEVERNINGEMEVGLQPPKVLPDSQHQDPNEE